MNTVSKLQMKDIAKLQANNAERQAIRARLDELDRQDNEILKRVADTEYKETEHSLDLSKFTYGTQTLLAELRDASNGIVSKDTIRQFVIGDEDAPDETVRTVIFRARAEMKVFPDCRYEIETVRRTGWRLVCKETFQNVSKPKKTRKKQRKYRETL